MHVGTRVKSPKANIRELVKTPKGKGIAAGLILVLLVLAVLMAMTFAFPMLNKQADQPVNFVAKRTPSKSTPKTQVSQATTSTTTADAVLVKGDLSSYRDPFKPLVVATSADGSSTTGGSTANESQTGSSASSVDVLSLESITTVDGQKTAIVLYGGQQYTVKAGDQIDSSPFQVTDIGDSNISLLYGDSRLTLQVGDTIVK